jgi:hypothetical protein
VGLVGSRCILHTCVDLSVDEEAANRRSGGSRGRNLSRNSESSSRRSSSSSSRSSSSSSSSSRTTSSSSSSSGHQRVHWGGTGGGQGCVGAALPATTAGSGEFGLEGTERVLTDQVQ